MTRRADIHAKDETLAAVASVPKEERDARRPFSVLVVDDDADTRGSLRDLFEAEIPPFLVLTAASGPEALDLLAGAPVDLVLVDYRMQPMDGLELLAEAWRRAPRVKRLMITAYPDMKVAIAAINEAHLEHFFLKPVDPDDLLRVVRGLRLAREEEEGSAGGFARDLDHLRRMSRRRWRTRGLFRSGGVVGPQPPREVRN